MLRVVCRLAVHARCWLRVARCLRFVVRCSLFSLRVVGITCSLSVFVFGFRYLLGVVSCCVVVRSLNIVVC